MNASELIDKRIAELNDWRGERLARLRQLIVEAAPGIVEEWKWDTPVWSQNGNVVAAGAFQDHVKLNFFQGALLEDHHLFNAGLDAKATRAIDIYERDKIDEAALKELVRAAASLNSNPKRKSAKAAITPTTTKKSSSTKKAKTTDKGSSGKQLASDLPKLSAPAQRALAGVGIQSLQQLTKFSEKEIKELHGIGPNAMIELRKALKKKGLSFRQR